MKSSQILKKARKLIVSGQRSYICNAVYKVCEGTDSASKGSKIEEYISKQLDGTFTLNSWLRKRHGINPSIGSRKLKQTRLAWIDWMIAAYEEKGD